MLLTELKEHSFEKEGAIKINRHNDVDYSVELKCLIIKSTKKPLNGRYYITDYCEEIRYYKNGKIHRDNNLPAIIWKDGSIFYFINGKPHRIDDPASIFCNGCYYWYINGYKIDKKEMDKWLNENNIPLDWNLWSDLDKFYFSLHWSDYNGK